MKSDEEVDSDITWKMNRNIFQNAVAIEDAASRGPRDRSRRTQYLSLSIVKLSHPDKSGANLVKVHCRRGSPQP